MERLVGAVFRAVFLSAVAVQGVIASAAIPASERDVLLALYASTNGASWATNSGWGGDAGSECSWYGIVCDEAAAHVIEVVLPGNNLVGTLPDISALTELREFHVGMSIPPVQTNSLSGALPSLSGLTHLEKFRVDHNQFTGSVPSLDELTALQRIDVYKNQLSGPIPSLAGLPNLRAAQFASNLFTGALPALAGCPQLSTFTANDNQLTGPVPALAELTNLEEFDISSNHLDGPIPPLAGLVHLQFFIIGGNILSGDLPPAPSTMLVQGASSLCPNRLNHRDDAAWDNAVGESPWYLACEDIFGDGFDGF